MLSTRLVIGSLMVGALIVVLGVDEWLAPWFPIWFLLAVVALGSAAVELVGLLGATSVRPSGTTVVAGIMALIVANWAPHLAGTLLDPPQAGGAVAHDPLSPVNDLGWPLLTFVGVMMATFVVQSAQFEKPGHSTAAIAGTLFVVAYIGLLGSFLIQFRWFDGPYHGIVPMAFLVAAAKGTDTGAYSVGRLIGRHKLWPRLSPNKTIEGAVGGLALGIVAALLIAAVARYALRVPTLGWLEAAGFGLVVAIVAQLGDLMESMIKRDCARKDASDAVPGFGGVLDVLDSLLFAAPVAYAYWLGFGP